MIICLLSIFTPRLLGVFAVIVGRIRQVSRLVGRVCNYDAECDDAGGDWCDRLVSPARGFLIAANLALSTKSEPALASADGDHCREMAGKVRELARYTRSPGILRELVALAKRYDRHGDHFDRRQRPKF